MKLNKNLFFKHDLWNNYENDLLRQTFKLIECLIILYLVKIINLLNRYYVPSVQ